jgi:hypothetical protein
MLYLILSLFAIAAIFGLTIAISIYQKKPSTPKFMVAAHGLFAATGLGLLVYYASNNQNNYPKVSVILFLLALLGGSFLFVKDMRGKPGPMSVVIVHAVVAVTAFLLLAVFVLF